MRGITQREYDTWRVMNRKTKRPVKQIEEAELQALYRQQYWDAMQCDRLEPGCDLCAFDAAVNSGVKRAQNWLEKSQDIDAFCSERLAFLQGLGRLWRVFGAGWRRRVEGIRNDAHLMSGRSVTVIPHSNALHAGMKGEKVRELQKKLRALGYPCGNIDGVFGEQVHRAVILFQHDNDLQGDPGIWLDSYYVKLDNAQPMLPKRSYYTSKTLEQAGDRPIARLNFLQRLFAWVFGASAATEAFQGNSVVDSMNGMRTIVEPFQEVFEWLEGNRWLLIAGACLGLIALIRLMRSEHVQAYQNFDYQGPATAKEEAQ